MVKKTTSRKVKRTKSRRTPSRKVKRTKSRSTTPRKVKRTKSRSSKRRKRRSTKKIMKGGVNCTGELVRLEYDASGPYGLEVLMHACITKPEKKAFEDEQYIDISKVSESSEDLKITTPRMSMNRIGHRNVWESKDSTKPFKYIYDKGTREMKKI